MITVNFIKQCEQAEELQRAWRPKDFDTFCYTKSREIGSACIDNREHTQKEYDENLKHQFWLPTLEQLFEMVTNYGHHGYNNGGIFFGIMKFADDNNLGKSHIKELFIQWMMFHKYNKAWTGEKWGAIK